MNNKIFSGFMVMALLILPAVAMANTYQYVDTSGNLQIVEADNATEAIATATNRGLNSGVMLVGKGGASDTTTYTPATTYTSNPSSGNYYQFVDTSGNLQGLWAANANEALLEAYKLGIHSGVMLVK